MEKMMEFQLVLIESGYQLTENASMTEYGKKLILLDDKAESSDDREVYETYHIYDMLDFCINNRFAKKLEV